VQVITLVHKPAEQLFVLQACDSDALPTQFAPPAPGAGLLQRRVLVWVPLSQVLLQVLHADQAPQLPLTIKIKDIFFKKFIQ
jgi:hypothetical protein